MWWSTLTGKLEEEKRLDPAAEKVESLVAKVLPPADGLLRVEVAGQQVVLADVSGQLSAMGATCSHYGGPLDEGSVQDECLVCPWHKSRFRLVDGGVARGPATSPQLSYDVRVVDDRVQLKVKA